MLNLNSWRFCLTGDNGVVSFFDLDARLSIGDCVVVEAVVAWPAIRRSLGGAGSLVVGVQTASNGAV